MNTRFMQIALAALAVTFFFSVINGANDARTAVDSTSYSQFLEDVESSQVREVTIAGQEIQGVRVDGTRFSTFNPDDPGLVGDLVNNGVNIRAIPPPEPSFLGQLFLSLLPIILLLGVWIFFMRRMQGGAGGSGIMSVGKSRARQFEADEVKVTLADVAGVEEARDEVGEIVDFLKDPGKFRGLGGVVPRGVLMVGSPGTGKTLLARAIAGEASVPFFTASGSDFVEMFVGVGASRVRDLFKQAKEKAPCIVFVDEIDAVGRRRGAGLGGGHDEREQTLNQLLVEMDGFEGNEGVIVIAATNRPDVLDPALLRPGRFDRQVVVPLPDVLGREKILNLHMRKVPIGDDVDARTIARGTPGFSGADLANLVNEAALFAARASRRMVGMEEFERAKDKITMGAERRSMVMSDEDKRLTAYHEAGHTIVGRLVPEQDPVHKVSIIPRGQALGVTLFLPEQDRFSASKRRLESQIATLFGGRLAEEIIFGHESVTTGAQNDIERATAIARDMVTKWGFAESLGPLAYQESEGEVFLGQAVTQRKQIAEETARQIDEEVRAVVARNYERARCLLTEHLDTLHGMADALMQYETLDAGQIDDLMAGREPRPPSDSDHNRGSRRRTGKGTGARPQATGIPAAQSFARESVSRQSHFLMPGVRSAVTHQEPTPDSGRLMPAQRDSLLLLARSSQLLDPTASPMPAATRNRQRSRSSAWRSEGRVEVWEALARVRRCGTRVNGNAGGACGTSGLATHRLRRRQHGLPGDALVELELCLRRCILGRKGKRKDQTPFDPDAVRRKTPSDPNGTNLAG